MTNRRVYCYRCDRLMLDGDPPAEPGLCVTCRELQTARDRAARWKRSRAKLKRRPQTPDELKAAGDPFAKLLNDDD